MKQFGISVIGAGRVAGALCRQMNRRGLSVVTIVSQSGSSAVELATALNSTASAGLFFDESSDLIIVAVPDDSIRDVLAGIRCSEKTIVAHTAGTVGLDIFPPSLKHTGVFYPLQTFSAGRDIDFDNLPFLIEASDELTSGKIGRASCRERV